MKNNKELEQSETLAVGVQMDTRTLVSGNFSRSTTGAYG